MRTSEIHDRFLKHFQRNGHEIVPSTSLVSPDPSLLFTIAGMVPFLPYILGTEPAPWPRVSSVQKCIRTNDIDNVGQTTRHGTFFQMAGNFSFGDYFKQGAIDLAWEFSTNADTGLGLDPERIWVTTWQEDHEAHDYLLKTIGLDPRRLVKLPREENFWDTGQPGPAGPTAELHYDRGPAYGPEAEGGNIDPGGDRYLEYWNLVFDQFVRGPGEGFDYELVRDLEPKAIDTGAGLERMAFLMQEKPNMYETDQVYPLIEATEQMTRRKYGANPDDDVSMRVIADHVRCALMLIGDGIRPGNDGRGYVLRRIVRRAIRSVRLLGVEEPALPHLLPISRDAMQVSYPEVADKFETISQVAYGEEDAFLRTLEAGTTILDTAVTKAKKAAGDSHASLSGSDAFALHDTYGFPIDLTIEIAGEHDVTVDEQGFRDLMAEQRERARADARAKKTGHVDTEVYRRVAGNLSAPVSFLGYTDAMAEATVAGLLVDGESTPAATAPANVDVVLTQTPFYAEQGGQQPDHGQIRLAGGGVVDVTDVQNPITGLTVHRGQLIEGTVSIDETAVAEIDANRRHAIARAHTATHMVHKALHEQLGDQATQAGSDNSPSRLRFDFRHGQAVPASVVGDIEGRVNERLSENLDITDEVMSMDEAQRSGAIALFGEKYGDQVRVVSIGGDWSKELCAGTHVESTGHLGLVTVLGEASIGSGVRRVDALVGDGAFQYQATERALVSQLTSMVGARPEELVTRVESMMSKLKAAEKELDATRQANLMAQAGDIAKTAVSVAGVQVATRDLGQLSATDPLRPLAQDVRAKLGDAHPTVVALTAVSKDRPVVIIATNESARQAGLRAGDLVKTAAGVLGGGGGGKSDIAQGGGADPAKTGEALEAVRTHVSITAHA